MTYFWFDWRIGPAGEATFLQVFDFEHAIPHSFGFLKCERDRSALAALRTKELSEDHDRNISCIASQHFCRKFQERKT